MIEMFSTGYVFALILVYHVDLDPGILVLYVGNSHLRVPLLYMFALTPGPMIETPAVCLFLSWITIYQASSRHYLPFGPTSVRL